ncbi:MAG: isoamylase early set domain-containing protein, partial [Tepidisphaeraceae bacterium]
MTIRMIRTRMIVAVVVLLAFAPLARAQQEFDHEFTYKPEGNPTRIHVAGDFNGWSKDATLMQKGSDGVWRAKIKVGEGVQHYKFVVDGETWVNDPNADKSLEVDDGHGGKNSGVLVGAAAEKLPPPKENSIRMEAVKHDPNDKRDISVFSPGSFMIAVAAQQDDVKS